MNNDAKTVDEYLQSVPAWQGKNLVLFRKLVHDVVPTIEEAIKWGVPVFMINGKMIFAMSGFKAHTKYNFILNGALLDDSDKLFNNGLESKKSRGIDLHENEEVDAKKLEALITQAVAQANL